MNDILLALMTYLQSLNDGKAVLGKEALQKLAVRAAKLLERRLLKRETGTFRLSQIGRPTCQLDAELRGWQAEPLPYSFPLQLLYGDLTEACLLLLISEAGIKANIDLPQVSLKLGDVVIKGTPDVEIDNKIWDIKSASPWSFEHKFKAGIDAILKEGDSFGYIAQGIGYAEASKKPFGGWIVVNKVTGEIAVCEIPADRYKEIRSFGLQRIRDGIRAHGLGRNQAPDIDVDDVVPFTRNFTDVEEYFHRRKTGNRILQKTCEFCRYKATCWPTLQVVPCLPSAGYAPKPTYYTYIDPLWKDKASGKNSPITKGEGAQATAMGSSEDS